MTAEPTTTDFNFPTDDQLNETIQTLMTGLDIPGVTVLLAAPGRDPWIASFGVSDRESGAPMHPEMHVRIGSITKPFTATLVLQLVDEGKISLDDTLSTLLPDAADFPYAERITLRHLLNMRSGIYNYTEEDGVFTGLALTPDRVWTDRELIDIARPHDAYFEPGADFHYSNTNYILLAQIIEKVTGKPFAEGLDERILSPFALAQTSYPTTSALPEPFAHGYERIPVGDAPASDDPEIETIVSEATNIPASIGAAAGAMVSNVFDMNLWIDILTQGRALSEAMHAEQLATIPVLKPDGTSAGVDYGLGVADFGGVIGHNGGIPGFQTFAGRSTSTGVNIIVVANIDHGKGGKGPADSIALAIRDLLTSAA